jgi:hypothetical protein
MSPHKKISFWKSGLRIFGYVIGAGAAAYNRDYIMYWAFLILIASEVLGIFEEIGEK